MQRSLPNRVWHEFLKFSARLGFVAIYQLRVWGREQVPATGGGLLLSNHQSNFDPIIIGAACDRRLNYVARQTLFGFAPLRWLILSVDAIPIDREGTGLSGLKETLKRLKREELVLLFPEGTRTADGAVRRMKPGFCSLARRGNVPLIPVAMDGAFDAWPRQRLLPGKGTIHVEFGPPLLPAEIQGLSDEALLAEVERRIRACHDAVRRRRQRVLQASTIDTAKVVAIAENGQT